METKSTAKGEYEVHVAAWQGSGKSQKDYCEANQLSYQTFTYWRRKLRRQDQPIFSEIKLKRLPADGCYFSVELSDGTIIRIHQEVSADFLRQLVGCR